MDATRQIGASSAGDNKAGMATPVNRRSDQFAEVHYMLEMVLAHANVKITHLQIWDVRNPAVRRVISPPCDLLWLRALPRRRAPLLSFFIPT